MASTAGKVLIRNGSVVNADSTEVVDVYIVGETIAKIGKNLAVDKDTRIFDASNKYVFPGGIDPHTHMEFEFMGGLSVDDFYHGTRAAVAGGTTTIIDFAIPKANESLIECYKRYRNKADEKVVCDYALHMGVTSWNEQVKKDMQTLVKEHGINSFKVFMAYKDMLMLDDASIYQTFMNCQEIGAIPMVHAENGHIIEQNCKRLLEKGITGPEGHALSRPEAVEAEATNRACVIAENAGSPLYVVHVMCKDAAEVIESKRKNGSSRIIGETLAAGLGVSLPETNDFQINAAHLMSPPLRSSKDTPKQLMVQLAKGFKGGLQTTGSDNCTFNLDQKSIGKDDFRKIPNGVNGVEDRLSVIWEKGVNSKILTPNQFVAATSTNAAKVFNIFPKKGCIAVGSDADIIIWDPSKSKTISAKTHFQKVDFNIFEGMTINGTCETVLVKGRVCYENGNLVVEKGWGKFVPTPSFPKLLYF